MNEEEWNRFIDTGSISREILEQIAKKIKNQEVLTEQEIAIYSAYHLMIELLLSQKVKR